MTTIPNFRQNVLDGALGLQDTSADRLNVKAGVCSGGVDNTLYGPYADKDQVIAELGKGALVEALCYSLSLPDAGPIMALKLHSSVAGVAGSVTKVGTGTVVMTVTGAPVDAFQVMVTIVQPAANLAAAAATFTYTLDGGDTPSDETAVPTSGTYAVADGGISFVFADGTFVAGDTYSFTCTAPGYSTTDVNNGFAVLLADPSDWGWVHVVGVAANVAGSATIASVLSTQMAALEAKNRYAFAIQDVADDTDANLKAGYASFTSVRVSPGAGFEELVSAVSGRIYKRNTSWGLAGRLGQIDVQKHPGEVTGSPNAGAILGVTKIYRDEAVTPGLDSAGFTTMRTLPGQKGFFLTRGKIMAPVGSDFGDIPHRRVMDKGCRVNRDALMRWLNKDLDIDPKTGFLTNKQRVSIEQDIEAQLRAALVDSGNASDVTFRLKPDNKILSNSKIIYKMRILPKGYAEYIEGDSAFTNPALLEQVA